MTKTTIRTTASSVLSIAAALAMPLAFAQAPPPAAGVDDAAATTSPAPPSSARDGAEPRQLTWADVDVDGSGAISQEESGQLPSLAQVFPDADADADGQLTPDEYKAYVATAGGPKSGAGGSD